MKNRRIYGLYLLLGQWTGYIPSQRLRLMIHRSVFQIKIDRNAVIFGGLRFRGGKRISLGAGTSVGERCQLDGRAELQIGRCVCISSEVMLWTAQHDYRNLDFRTTLAPVKIEDWCWIGPRVIVLPGVTVAEGSVIAAGAVVTRSTERYGVYAGIPAKRIESRPSNAPFTYKPSSDYVPFI